MNRLLVRIALFVLASALLAVSASPASADSFKPGQTSNLTAGAGSWVEITDHESFGSNEVGTYNISGTSLGTLGYSLKTFGPTKRSWCVGGEVRLELETRGWTLDPFADTMRVEGRLNLYEGASCATNDLDGQTTWHAVHLRPGQSWPIDFKIWNTHEGGDWAQARVNFTASK